MNAALRRNIHELGLDQSLTEGWPNANHHSITPAMTSSMSPMRRRNRARVAGLIARGALTDDPRLIEARQDLQAADLADQIRRIAAATTPLRQEQRVELASLLLAGDQW